MWTFFFSVLLPARLQAGLTDLASGQVVSRWRTRGYLAIYMYRQSVSAATYDTCVRIEAESLPNRR